MDLASLTNYDQALAIHDFDGYMIYSDGRVWSNKSNKFLKPTIDKGGYPRVILWKHSKGYCMKLHRLVAMHFIPNPNNLPEVNHISGDKLNPHYSNLEWCTRSENVLYSYAIGLMEPVHPLEHENYRRTMVNG